MATVRHAPDPAARLYRITPWPIRIAVPFLAFVLVIGLIHDGAALAIPIPIILGTAWIYAGEHCGLVVTDEAIESRMTRRENRFRHRWAEVDGFDLLHNGSQVAIVMRLRAGSRVLLPSTRAWVWNKRTVVAMLTALRREHARAR